MPSGGFVYGPPFKLADLAHDERTLLLGGHTNFRALMNHESPASVMAFRGLRVAVYSTLVFALAVWSYVVGSGFGLASWALYGLAYVLTAYRVLVLAVLVASVIYAQYWRSCYRKSLIFWAWLPCVHIIHCALAIGFGTALGHYLWQHYLGPYHELSRLKVYNGLNVDTTPGTEVMDAGLVEFSDLAGVDRARGGCYKNYGHTYCVAPIVNRGRLSPTGVGNMPHYGSYDYFAVGVDCCTCPMTDFRCGDWFDPDAQGGLRSIDEASRPKFHLAVQDWAASFGKDVAHALFFTWAKDPIHTFHGYFEKTIYISCLAVGLWLVTTFACAMMIAQVLQMLVRNNIASPLDTPPPPPGVEKIWYWFLPHMLYFAEEERRQYLGLPESQAPFYPPAPSIHGHREAGDADSNFRHAHALGPAYAPPLMAEVNPLPAADHGFRPAPAPLLPSKHQTYGYGGTHY